jgi:hypothetical protein
LQLLGASDRQPEDEPMRLFAARYRDLPRFMLRRIDRIAGEVNAFLIAVAIGLAMLDLLYAVQRLVDALPPPVLWMAVHGP